MKSLSSVGLGLSIVFGCILLALMAELYYLLWWKNRLRTTTTTTTTSRSNLENDFSNPAREFFYMFCWKKSANSIAESALTPQEIRFSEAAHHLESNKDSLFKPFEDDDVHGSGNGNGNGNGNENPRLLFTIIEETMEDLESSDESKSNCDKNGGFGSRGRSLSDLILTVETPFLTPLASPPFLTPPLTPIEACFNHHGFNPLFESETDAGFNRLLESSSSPPPPRFNFSQQAEDKLHGKSLMAAEVHTNGGFSNENGDIIKDEEDGSFITIHC